MKEGIRPISESLKTFENGEKIIGIRNMVVDYLSNNPLEVGHGYSHFKKVARECYLLGEKEGIERLDLLYICGLCHDIYRPAKGQGAQEDHEKKSGEIVREIFSSVLPANDLNLVVSTIVDHDKEIIEGKGTKMMKILSLADKDDMSAQRCVAYAWASNKNNQTEKEKPYTSFDNIRKSFHNYKLKAFKVFGSINLEMSDAFQKYSDTDLDLSMLVEQEKSRKIEFYEMYTEIAITEAKLDVEYLLKDDVDKEIIAQITCNYKDLLMA